MRTTLQIDDDVLEAVRALARAENKTLGQVATTLIKRGLEPRPDEGVHPGFPVFDVPQGTRPVTLELVKRAENGG